MPLPDYKLGITIVGILLHDMPEDWHTTNLDHWLWFELAFFANARAEATGKKNDFRKFDFNFYFS